MIEYLHPAQGKVRLKNSLLNRKTKTIQLQTGAESGYLALDIDDPKHPNNQALLKIISREDFIVYSSEYTLDDVFAGKCRYKVIFKYQGKHIPAKKTNKAIEIFYQKSKYVAIAGKRGDGHEYVFGGDARYIYFDVNDVLETKVPFSLIEKPRPTVDDDNQVAFEETIEEVHEGDEVSIEEFKNLAGKFVEHLPVINQKGEGLLTFECLFPHTHTSKNYGYAFKRDGHYIAKCQGQACEAEYDDLNTKMEEYYVNRLHFDNTKGFDINKEGVTMFLAPTGWGKTEAIAEEVLKAVNEDKKLLILLQNKEAIARLLDRVDYKSNNALSQLEEFKKIFVYISENKDEDFVNNVNMANVIISHHYYFKNAGDVLTYYPSSKFILDLPNLEVIIDEAHSYIEMATRLDLEIGGLYESRVFNGKEVLLQNTVGYTASAAKKKDNLEMITNCLEAYVSDFGTISLNKQSKMYRNVDYMDVRDSIKEKLTLIHQFDEDNYRYWVYKNETVQPIKGNSIEDAGSALDLLLDPAEYAVVGINKGDDLNRRNIGDMNLTIYHSQNINQMLTLPKKVIMTTATLNTYHEEIIERYVEYDKIVIEDDIKKVGKIVLLRPQDKNYYRIRNKVLDTVSDLRSNSLLFFPTIAKSKDVLMKYPNAMMNDNGYYLVGKRFNSQDYVDNIDRNLTIVPLEGSGAKGYNYLEEIENNSKGFELIYFDREPVSPQIVKKFINRYGELVDYESDYNISTFAQAIGRALRKDKKTLTLAMNDINDYTFSMIKTYLETYTDAVIVEDDLSITNIKLSISSYIYSHNVEELKETFKNNKLFKKLYMEDEDGKDNKGNAFLFETIED